MQDSHAVVNSIIRDYRNILQNSSQAIIVFIDDENQISNENLADMLGYDSEEWSGKRSVLGNLDEESREALLAAHRRAVEDKVASSRIVSWKKKDGEVVGTEVMIVPLPYDASTYSIWFIDITETTGTFQV